MLILEGDAVLFALGWGEAGGFQPFHLTCRQGLVGFTEEGWTTLPRSGGIWSDFTTGSVVWWGWAGTLGADVCKGQYYVDLDQ